MISTSMQSPHNKTNPPYHIFNPLSQTIQFSNLFLGFHKEHQVKTFIRKKSPQRSNCSWAPKPTSISAKEFMSLGEVAQQRPLFQLCSPPQRFYNIHEVSHSYKATQPILLILIPLHKLGYGVCNCLSHSFDPQVKGQIINPYPEWATIQINHARAFVLIKITQNHQLPIKIPCSQPHNHVSAFFWKNNR